MSGPNSPTSFFAQLGSSFGDHAQATARHIAQCHDKLTRAHNRRRFLTRCRREKVMPQHIQMHVPSLNEIYIRHHNFTRIADKIMLKFKRSILSLEIRVTHHSIKEYTRRLEHLKQDLVTLIPREMYHRFMCLEGQKQHRMDLALRRDNIQKFGRLRDRTHLGTQLHDNKESNSIVNLTETLIPDEVVRLLNMGPKFAINPSKRDKQTHINLLADVECILTHAFNEDPDIRNDKRQRVNNIIMNYSNRPPIDDHIGRFYRREFKQTQTWLREHKELIVTTADKGNKTVMITVQDYGTKMTHILSDNNVYQEITRDPTNTVTTKHNNLIKKIIQEGGIEQTTGKRLLRRNGTLGRIYGQVKIHKIDKPLRPIISTIGTTTYGTAQFLSRIFNQLIGITPYCAIDSFTVAEQLKQMIVPPGHIMVSFDVVSMFTSIPKDLVIQIVNERHEELTHITTLNKTHMHDLLNFIFENCFFTYDHKIYKQTSGLPMGAALSPALANLVMNKLITYVTSRLNNIFYITRYVDDLFLIVPEVHLQDIFNEFNSFHENICFTMEKEHLNTINFLELTIKRGQDGRLSLSWYRKPTASLRYINFYSNHPQASKRNIVTLLGKRLRAFTDLNTRKTEREKVIHILRQNDYPMSFILRHLDMTEEDVVGVMRPLSSWLETRDSTLNALASPERIFMKIPYIQGLSQQIRKILKTDRIDVVFYNTYTLGQLYTNTKSIIPTGMQSGLIYRLQCDCGASYVGQTKQYLKERVKQHQYSINRIKKNLPLAGNQTGVTQHIGANPEHTIDWGGVRILDREQNYHRRLVKEAIHIYKTVDSINLNEDIDQHVVSLVYSNVIDRLC